MHNRFHKKSSKLSKPNNDDDDDKKVVKIDGLKSIVIPLLIFAFCIFLLSEYWHKPSPNPNPIISNVNLPRHGFDDRKAAEGKTSHNGIVGQVSNEIKLPNKAESDRKVTEDFVYEDVLDRLSVVDKDESKVADILDVQIPQQKGKDRGKKPPPEDALRKPPTLREIREGFSVSPYLELTKPWGHVYTPNRIMCTVPSLYPGKEETWKLIMETWGQLCDVVYFVVKDSDDVPEEMFGGKLMRIKMKRTTDPSARNIWEKVWNTWLHIATTELLHEAEWFLKIDDDTFFSPENFKGFTRYLDPEQPYYIGHTILWRWSSSNIVFNSGSCYALSREAMRRLVPQFSTIISMASNEGPSQCIDRDGAGEDPTMGICLRAVGINPLNTLDEDLRNRFVTFQIADHQSKMWSRDPRDGDSYYWRFRPFYMGDTNTGCCSKNMIAAHSYKRQFATNNFPRLHKEWNQKKDWDNLPLPPRPRVFLFDPDMTRFEMDEFRNAINRVPRGQRIQIRKDKMNYCWKCDEKSRFWIPEFDENREESNEFLPPVKFPKMSYTP